MKTPDLRALALAARSRNGKWYPRLGDATNTQYLEARPKIAHYIAACSPDRILALLDEIDALKLDAGRYRMIRADPSWSGFEHDFRPDEFDRCVDSQLPTRAANAQQKTP